LDEEGADVALVSPAKDDLTLVTRHAFVAAAAAADVIIPPRSLLGKRRGRERDALFYGVPR
jgi:hypothetical protein